MNKNELQIFKYAIGALAGIILIALVVRAIKQRKTNRLVNGNNYGPGTGIGANIPTVLDEDKVLAEGVRGPEVSELQKLLNRDGASPVLQVDGIFGPLTGAALRAEIGTDIIRLREYRNRAGNASLASFQNSMSPNNGGLSA